MATSFSFSAGDRRSLIEISDSLISRQHQRHFEYLQRASPRSSRHYDEENDDLDAELKSSSTEGNDESQLSESDEPTRIRAGSTAVPVMDSDRGSLRGHPILRLVRGRRAQRVIMSSAVNSVVELLEETERETRAALAAAATVCNGQGVAI